MATDSLLPLSAIQRRPEFDGILRTAENYGTGRGEDLDDQLNSSFDRLMLQSGLELSPVMLLMLTLYSGVALGGLLFVLQENLLTAALGCALGAVIPILTTVIIRSRRQTKILNQMPEMVDELARAGRTGRSIEQCFTMVAQDTPSPLGDELRLCSHKLALGLSLRDALRELPERTGVVSLNIFVMALTVHLTGGGDLVAVLERLSRTIRERIQFLGRLKAATAPSRATAILMVVLPPGILGFFMVRDPEYFTKLIDAPWGRMATILAVLLDIVGVVWVLRILKNSQRS